MDIAFHFKDNLSPTEKISLQMVTLFHVHIIQYPHDSQLFDNSLACIIFAED